MTEYRKIKLGLRTLMALALTVAFALPAQAPAQEKACSDTGSDPTEAQYCEINSVNAGEGEQGIAGKDSGSSPSIEPVSNVSVPGAESAVEATSGSGPLPFTGLDAGILLAVAALLAGTGLALRQLTTSER